MGLIKTAILTGGGMYAVSKIAQTVEHRNNHNSNHNHQAGPNYPRENPYPAQNYYGPPPPPFQGPPPHRPAHNEPYGVPYPAETQRDYDPSSSSSSTSTRGNYYPPHDQYPGTGYEYENTGIAPPNTTNPAAKDAEHRYIEQAAYPPAPPSYAKQNDNPPAYSYSYAPGAPGGYVSWPRGGGGDGVGGGHGQEGPRGFEQSQQQQQQQSLGPLRDLAVGVVGELVSGGKRRKSSGKGKRRKGDKGGELFSGVLG